MKIKGNESENSLHLAGADFGMRDVAQQDNRFWLNEKDNYRIVENRLRIPLNRDLKRTGKIYVWFNFFSTYYLLYYFIHPQRHSYSLINLSFFCCWKAKCLVPVDHLVWFKLHQCLNHPRERQIGYHKSQLDHPLDLLLFPLQQNREPLVWMSHTELRWDVSYSQ